MLQNQWIYMKGSEMTLNTEVENKTSFTVGVPFNCVMEELKVDVAQLFSH